MVLQPSELRRTPLHARHLTAGGRMVDFAGWAMPVQYDSVIKEHERVRTHAGLFDVSHMGEFFFSGPGAVSTLDNLSTNHVAQLQVGQALYTALCNERGGTRDDVLVYRLAHDEFMLVVNAANTDKIRDWSRAHLEAETEFVDRTEAVALLALQGPRSREILQQSEVLGGLAQESLSLPYYHFVQNRAAGETLIVSRTGYTGELGYEIYCEPRIAQALWDELLEKGSACGLGPAGLGARDTLRFEVGYCLYGHELEEDVTPLEAGIAWTVKLRKENFIGRAALAQQKKAGVPRRLVGLELRERAIACQGFDVLSGGRIVGQVTSGTFAPSLGRSLSMALIDSQVADQPLALNVRGREIPAERVPLPFYKPSPPGSS